MFLPRTSPLKILELGLAKGDAFMFSNFASTWLNFLEKYNCDFWHYWNAIVWYFELRVWALWFNLMGTWFIGLTPIHNMLFETSSPTIANETWCLPWMVKIPLQPAGNVNLKAVFPSLPGTWYPLLTGMSTLSIMFYVSTSHPQLHPNKYQDVCIHQWT